MFPSLFCEASITVISKSDKKKLVRRKTKANLIKTQIPQSLKDTCNIILGYKNKDIIGQNAIKFIPGK